jgi:hypothetical protein
MKTIALVLRSGGSFGPEHVNWLTKQIRRYHPYVTIYLLTDIKAMYHDVDVCVPLKYNYPGWWSKMELCRQDISLASAPSVLYLDLDTVITGPLSDLLDSALDSPTSTALRGFKRKDGINSSVMMLCQHLRAAIWKKWQTSPGVWMERYAVKGDQKFLGDHFGPRFEHWQDSYPEAILSYEVDLRSGLLQPPAQTSVVVFHGPPRPWDVDLPWVPKFRKDIA